ncbi:MAG: isoprenylcysteine carboxylmethyltransferase family protein [bacterium TMED144]|nr:MAG: isoprenylcysteine carboxylmethyltransferase family protein [bacterium TMED144]
MKKRIPPPIITMLCVLVIFLSKSIFPSFVFSYKLEIGIVVSIAGLLLLAVSVKSFINNNTTINPLNLKKSTYLVTNGLFRFSRNPMYLGMLLFLVGTSIILNIIGGLIISILFIFYMNFFQIIPEEKALENLFGKDYRNYKKNIRRWI